MKTPVGIRSLSVSFPSVLRTNDHFRKTRPELVAEAEKAALARLWKKQGGSGAQFDAEMEPYLGDPFRGTRYRRVLGPDETCLSLEIRAARQALEAAALRPSDIDCMIVASFLPMQPGVGNAAFLAGALDYEGAAYNLESACTSAAVATQSAVALIRAGECERVLVVVSCTYSRVSDDRDSLCWFLGDGAGAYVVSAVPEGQGVLGMKIVNTSKTCNTFYYDLHDHPTRGPMIRIGAHERTGRVLGQVSGPYLVECCDGALAQAGLTRDDVRFFVFNTPTAWYGRFCAQALGVSPERTIDTYPEYANIGPALMPVNLYTAARAGRIAPGDVVLVYTIGSVSTAGAVVMRWGDVGLGPEPPPPAMVE
ncbi:3-oxoacyl-[acyl-carrier-protein] synthase, KASIII [Minicystis rosea]|nr:3-oxoacyl-[acyl-carrier-protein] synthase, KASIII [Minicystis rosea]